MSKNYSLFQAKLTGLNNVLRMSVTSLVYLSSPCAKHSGKVEILAFETIFLGDHSIHVQFSKFYFLHFIAQVRIFFVQKKPKIFGFKNVMERGIKKNFSLS